MKGQWDRDEVTIALLNSIDTICEEKNFTHGAFALYAGISKDRLARYFMLKALPNTEALVKISLAYDVSIDWLLGLSDKR